MRYPFGHGGRSPLNVTFNTLTLVIGQTVSLITRVALLGQMEEEEDSLGNWLTQAHLEPVYWSSLLSG